jgi:hypothetical protein
MRGALFFFVASVAALLLLVSLVSAAEATTTKEPSKTTEPNKTTSNTTKSSDKTAGRVVGSIFIIFAGISVLLVVWWGFKKGKPDASDAHGSLQRPGADSDSRAELRSNPAHGYGATS